MVWYSPRQVWPGLMSSGARVKGRKESRKFVDSALDAYMNLLDACGPVGMWEEREQVEKQADINLVLINPFIFNTHPSSHTLHNILHAYLEPKYHPKLPDSIHKISANENLYILSSIAGS